MNVRTREIIFQLKKFIKQLGASAIETYSAQAAFYVMIAMFPFIMLIMTLIQFLPVSQKELQDILFSIVPKDTGPFMQSVMTDIHQKASGTLISITAVTTLWAASNGVFSLMKGINSAYRPKFPETRGYIKLKAISIIFTVFFIIMLIATMGVLVFGNRIQEWIEGNFQGLTGTAGIILSLRTIIGIVILTVFSLTMYVLVPNRKGRVREELPGAVISAVGWVVFSYAYSFYIDKLSNYSKFYGSMTAVVLLMLWLYFCMYIMLLGAQINVFIQNRK